jgi:hypothetical protein
VDVYRETRIPYSHGASNSINLQAPPNESNRNASTRKLSSRVPPLLV